MALRPYCPAMLKAPAATIAAILLASACTRPDATADPYAFDPNAGDAEARYVFYAHGKIIEDQGRAAVSEEFGAYEYEGILEALSAGGLTVFSEIRPKDADAEYYAGRIAERASALIANGVPASHITIIGASKGAYIAALAASDTKAPVNAVLIASCNQQINDALIKNGVRFTGRVLAIRDRADAEFAGSCADVFEASPDMIESSEIITMLDVGHGLVYRPYPEWTEPATDWAKE